jgi:hypothetical protein
MLAEKELAQQEVDRVLASTFHAKLEAEILVETRATKRVKELFDGQGLGANLASADGTAWGLLNAVTQYTDHEYGRSGPDARLTRAWFGEGERVKRRALTALLEEVPNA